MRSRMRLQAAVAPGVTAPAPRVEEEWSPAVVAAAPVLARPRAPAALLVAILGAAAFLRGWDLGAVGLNSDEAVYNGQGASIAGESELAPYFPTFRAHPLLFQTLLSFGFQGFGDPELFGRLASGALGVATVWVVFLTGRLMYGVRAGLVAALLIALMPYHVVVTRQILLDGPMVLWATVTLYLLARYAVTRRFVWLYAAAGAMGLTVLSKEGSIILLGSVYAFMALTPVLRFRLRNLVGPAILFVVVCAAFPLALHLAGAEKTGGNFLAWQLFRRPNHTFLFYPAVVPLAIGLGVVLAATLGMWLQRRRGTWRETLLVAWIAVPVAFFELFPIKGFQYLLPIAPAVALLAARFLATWRPSELPLGRTRELLDRRWLMPAAIAAVAVSLALPSWQRIQPSSSSTFLAGSGGVPGGREAGRWIDRHVPVGAQMMSVGPSMANILQYYGRRKIYGLSVSPNPLHRNPVYEAMSNPDRMIRDNELQYVVWDAFSADRSPFFARRILRYVERYNGSVVHQQAVPVKTAGGRTVRKPVITIYEVRP
jgi:dolichyl-phosphate-mannose-protein mannosyltransferase